jgi:outer membrane protein assembly factor BamE (lipoprotein component of BamABCDE complex)
MKRFLMGFLAVAMLVAFTAPSFAGEEKKKEEKKKGGKLIEQIYADDMKKGEKKDEKKGK